MNKYILFIQYLFKLDKKRMRFMIRFFDIFKSNKAKE